nr:MAG TPA: hypothetical protein [Caudoviricetes sp.]
MFVKAPSIWYEACWQRTFVLGLPPIFGRSPKLLLLYRLRVVVSARVFGVCS